MLGGASNVVPLRRNGQVTAAYPSPTTLSGKPVARISAGNSQPLGTDGSSRAASRAGQPSANLTRFEADSRGISLPPPIGASQEPPHLPRQQLSPFETTVVLAWGAFLVACAGYVLWKVLK